jgi:hypothetical protein
VDRSERFLMARPEQRYELLIRADAQ